MLDVAADYSLRLVNAILGFFDIHGWDRRFDNESVVRAPDPTGKLVLVMRHKFSVGLNPDHEVIANCGIAVPVVGTPRERLALWTPLFNKIPIRMIDGCPHCYFSPRAGILGVHWGDLVSGHSIPLNLISA